MRTGLHALTVLGVVIAVLSQLSESALAADVAPADKVYELRVYHAHPGKLEALHARFRDHTCKLFQKHGIEMIGFWTPTEGAEAKDTLYYIVA
jgi:hypothetical protein